MQIFLQLLIAGIATGAIYALMAVGLGLLWQTSGAINFAQGEFIMLPAFVMLWAMGFFGVGLIPAFLIALVLMMISLGFFFKEALADPLLGYGTVPAWALTLIFAAILNPILRWAWSSAGLVLLLDGFMLNVAGSKINLSQIATFVISLALVAFFQNLPKLLGQAKTDPLIKSMGDVPLIIATIGLGVILKESARNIWGANALPFPTLVEDQIINLGGFRFGIADLVTLAIAVLIITGLQIFLNKTFVGRSMEATAQNPETARILGINVDRMILYTYLINAALVTAAALLVTPSLFAKFSTGEVFGLIAFMAAIVGGFNQVRGALFGGFLLGIIDNFAKFYLVKTPIPFLADPVNLTPYAAAIPLILLIIVILFKPEGLFGRREERTI
ncbi:MAG: branched-chain amino acid ABC transporter permease [Chloroflexota bacterium]